LDLVLGALIGLSGAVLGFFGQVLTATLTSRRERDARRDARQFQLEDLQRNTLLELQEALGRFGQVHGSIRASRPWERLYLDESLDIEVHRAGLRVLQLQERIRDDELRNLVDSLHEPAATVCLSKQEAEVQAGWIRLTDRLLSAHKRLGAVLRQYV
jgi:hypothetical protein